MGTQSIGERTITHRCGRDPGWIKVASGERTTIRVGRQRCRERTAVTPRTLASAYTEQQ